MKNEAKNIEKRHEVKDAQDAPVFVPVTDVYEKQDLIVVRCDMPGVTEDKLEVTLENNELTISGTQQMAMPEGMDRMIGEYEPGVFLRTFRVTQEIDHEKIKARLRNGVLDIELPKAETAKPKKIAITAG